MEWFALLIPLLAAGAAVLLFGKRITWWEIALPVAIGVVIILITKGTAEWTQTRDTEYWGGYVQSATYYERWDEEVPCTHPHYVTETYTYECGDGKTSRSCTGTRQVQQGYEHPYDVDYHPPVWQAEDSNGGSWSLSPEEYARLCSQFGNKTFRDLHRVYHSIDGNAYDTTFGGQYERLEPVVSMHSYENRVAASDSVLNYREIEEPERKARGLARYPTPHGYDCPSVLSRHSWAGETDLKKLNALYGRKKQVRVWLIVFQNAPADNGELQEAYWKRGNKNELTIVTSVDEAGTIQWCHAFCWCDDQSIKVDTESYLASGKTLDVAGLAAWLGPEIDAKWKRKRFRDFSYISVQPSPTAITLLYVIVVVTTAGSLTWAVINEHETPEQK